MTASIWQPTRTDDEVELDLLWHIATFCTDPQIATRHWQRFNEARRLRAERASGLGGLAGPDAALPSRGGIAVDGQLTESYQLSQG